MLALCALYCSEVNITVNADGLGDYVDIVVCVVLYRAFKVLDSRINDRVDLRILIDLVAL